ncbi:MAG: arylsulfatase A-like enzyme [Candidatus Azotimanducaceae bacterium]|jgi:arylsulfatase A-like enzyme
MKFKIQWIRFFLPVCALLQSACATERLNVVHIVVDDLGVMDVGFMGDERYQTSNIDRLASQGMIFTNGYAPAANCAPSRACVLTGQYPMSHGVYTVQNSDRGEASTRKIIPTPNTP